ncbi:MAG TPA: hypothetical protein VF131_14535 [Blastocatellia bacterium]|nr:hypothetical protein [Blastocatellia bacterium]
MDHSARRVNTTILMLTTTMLLVAFATPLFAQAGRRSAAVERARAKEADLQHYNREMALRNLGKREPLSEQQQRLALKQIKEDFERMQAVNNEMMLTVSRAEALDYKRISETLSEINKRAKRLRTNLRMEDGERGQALDAASDGVELKQSLYRLDGLIMSFVTSPLFQNPNVIHTDLRAKANRDLEGIIEMSQTVRKNAERLGKAPAK